MLCFGLESSLEMQANKLCNIKVIGYICHTCMGMEVTDIVVTLILACKGWLGREGIVIVFNLIESILQ